MDNVRQLIDSIEQGNASGVFAVFDKIMAEKLATAIEEKKEEVVAGIFEDTLKEEYEQLDELSKETLGKYVKKANLNTIDHAHNLGDKRARASEIDRFTNRLDV